MAVAIALLRNLLWRGPCYQVFDFHGDPSFDFATLPWQRAQPQRHCPNPNYMEIHGQLGLARRRD